MPIPVMVTRAVMIVAPYLGQRLYSKFFGKKHKIPRVSPAYKIREADEPVSNESPVPIIYGYNKVEGHVIYREQNNARIFDLAIGLGEGEIEEIKNIKVNDIPIGEIPSHSLTDITISFKGIRIYDSDSRIAISKFSGETNGVDNYVIVKGSLYNDGAYRIHARDPKYIEIDDEHGRNSLTTEPAGARITLTTDIGFKTYLGTTSQIGDDIFKKGMVKLQPTEDSWVDEDLPDTINGGSDGLVVKIRGTGEVLEKYTYLKFNLDDLPAGLTITKAVLRIPVYDITRDGKRATLGQSSDVGEVVVYNATTETGWTEDDLTWNTKSLPLSRCSDFKHVKNIGAVQEFKLNKEYGLPFLNDQYTAGADATLIIKDKETVAYAMRYEVEYTSTESVYKNAVLELHYEGGTPQGYKNTAYIALTIDTQSEKLGSSLPRITAEVKGRLIKNWTGAAYETSYSNNPVWCILDLLTNTRYGLGISESDLKLASFITAADYCNGQVAGDRGDENRFECNIVFDSMTDAYSMIQEMLLTMRGRIFPLDDTLTLSLEAISGVDHTFTVDNIVKDSFSYYETDESERPNIIRVSYTNPEKDFKIDYVQVGDAIDIAERGSHIQEYQCISINKKSQATRYANFLLWKAKQNTKGCTFSVSINNCDVAVNDICKITHPVPNWTEKKFRILQASESFRDDIRLICEEYDATVYYEPGTIPVVYDETPEQPPGFERPAVVTDLTLSETHQILDDGTYVPQIEITFTEPDYYYPLEYQIWYKKEGDSWRMKTSIISNRYLLAVDEVATYYIRIVSNNTYFDYNTIWDDSPQSSIAMVGQNETPSIPTVAGIDWAANAGAEWTTGTIYHKGTAYKMASGDTTDEYIYFDPDVSETGLLTSATRPTMNSDTWIMAIYDAVLDEVTVAQGFKLLHAGLLQADTITADEISANTITATEVNFTVVDGTNIVGTINASSEGIDISGAKINIAGTTTFTSGWAAATNAETDIDVLNTQNAPAVAGATDNTVANLKARVFRQTTAPVADMGEGDTWIDTNDGDRPYNYTGAAWEEILTIIDGGKITTGTIDASVVTVTNISATNITTGTLTGLTIQTAASGKRAVIDGSNNKFSLFNAGDAEIIRIDDNVTGYSNTPVVACADSTYGGIVVCANNPTLASATKRTTVSDGQYDQLTSESGIAIIWSITTGDGSTYIRANNTFYTSGDIVSPGTLAIDDINLDGSITMDAGELVDGYDVSVLGLASHAQAHTIGSHTSIDEINGHVLYVDSGAWTDGTLASAGIAAASHAHAQLHDRAHVMTSTSDHQSTSTWRMFISDASNDVNERVLGAASTYLKGAGTSAFPTWSTITHAETTGKGVNDHHNQAHTHASHSGISIDDHIGSAAAGQILYYDSGAWNKTSLTTLVRAIIAAYLGTPGLDAGYTIDPGDTLNITNGLIRSIT